MLRQINALDAGGAGTLGTPYVGIPGGAIPVGSYIYDSLDLPADAGKYYRGEVLTWPAQGTLTVFENGAYEYDPQNASGTQTFTVQLYENDEALGAPITVTLTIGSSSTVTSVTVSPAAPSVAGGAQQQFTATVTGTGSPAQTVTWTASAGTITGAGLFTAPAATASVQTITVTATSTVDGTKSGTATVTVPALAYTQYPAPADVRAGVRYGPNGEYVGTLSVGQ